MLTLSEFRMLMEAKAAKEARDKARKAEEERAAAIAAGTALAVPEDAALDINRQGFQSFPLDGGEWELLVAETVDGRLALADSYISQQGAEGRYSRPKLQDGAVPAEPLLWHIVPWVERGGSDVFKRKPATNKIKKLYFVNLETHSIGGADQRVYNLERVFCFDGESRAFAPSPVRKVGRGKFVEPVLRIRPSGLTLEEAFLLPDPIEVSMSTAMNLADMSEEELEARLAELEREAETMDEMDEVPDVPSVDMM